MLDSRCRVKQAMRSATVMSLLAMGIAIPVAAQSAADCDFDISDNIGTFVWGNTLHLSGRAGAGTNIGEFVISNDTSNVGDMDRDGRSPAGVFLRFGVPTVCDYANLIVPDFLRVDLVNVDNPSIAIPNRNIIVTNLPRDLARGEQARVNVFVELPRGTPAGRYIGRFGITDAVLFPTLSPTGEVLGSDAIVVEVVVAAEPAISLLDPQEEVELDSVVIRGRAGQRASSVFRLANAGNAALGDLRLSATDLRSESAVGLVIPASNITFAPATIPAIQLQDTVRVTVTVQIPRGILGGRYRGSILVQSAGATAVEVPLIVIVTSTRGILFTNNPVRGSDGVAQFAFNGDPGTRFKVGVFDMTGRMVWESSGEVFAGVGGTAGTPTSGADFAHSVTWSLVNLRGEPVASGMYLVVVESIVKAQRTLGRDRLMVIR